MMGLATIWWGASPAVARRASLAWPARGTSTSAFPTPAKMVPPARTSLEASTAFVKRGLQVRFYFSISYSQEEMEGGQKHTFLAQDTI